LQWWEPSMADLRKLKHDALEAAGKGNWRKAAWCYANLEKDDPAEPGWILKLGESLRKLGNDPEAIKAFSRAVDAYAKSDLLLKAIAVCKIILSLDAKHTQTQEMLASFYTSQRHLEKSGAAALEETPPPSPVSVPVAPPESHAATAPPSVLSLPPPESFEPIPTPVVPRPAAIIRPPGAATPSTQTASAQTHAPPQTLRPLTVAAAPMSPPLRQLRIAAMFPGAHPSKQIPAAGSSSAMEIPVDDDFMSEYALPTTPHKGAGRHTMARFVLPKTPFFTVLTPELLRMAIERVRLIQLPAGEILFSQGDPGDALYVVAWGEIAVLVPQEVARLSEGDFFGEIALLADRPRTATVRSTVDSQVLAIDRPLLNDLIAASPDLLKVLFRFLRERLIATLAETSPLFAPFTPLERIGLAARFHILEIDNGLRVIEEGSKSAGLFVLLAGEADVVSGDRVLTHLDSGHVFGEVSLISGKPSTASIVMRSKSFVLFLPRSDFSEVIMTHPQVLEHISSLVETRMRAIGRVDIL
jgi:cAMP-dependent protein kinase regulator